jgi:hypothetical protein
MPKETKLAVYYKIMKYDNACPSKVLVPFSGYNRKQFSQVIYTNIVLSVYRIKAINHVAFGDSITYMYKNLSQIGR